MKATITMAYIGGRLSVNAMKIVRAGHRVHRNWPEVDEWLGRLAEKSAIHRGQFGTPVYVKVTGNFVDERHPDLDNLFKAVFDGLKMGLGIDDKHFIPSSGGYTIGHEIPFLTIDLEDGLEC